MQTLNQSNRLNTIALSLIHFIYFEAISSVKTKKKTGELVYLPPEVTETETSLSVWVLV